MRKGIILALAVLATAILVCGEEVLAKEKDKKTVTVANINIFHGIPCAAVGDTTQCRLAERIDLLFKHLAAIGCPDIVTLQEVLDREDVLSQNPEDGSLDTISDLTSALSLIKAKLSAGEDCGSEYKHVIYSADPTNSLDQRPLFEGTDEELILSRYPIEQHEVRLLHSALFVPAPPPDFPPFLRMFLQAFARHVLFARINHPDVGRIDVFTTHLAASEDFGDNKCHSNESFSFNAQGTLLNITFDVPCPAECDGAKTVRQCEARQVANFVKELHDDVRTPAFITGDLNAQSHSAVYKEIINADHRRKHRWIDSYLAADNPECNHHTGIGCTAGRNAVGHDLEKPALNVDERIDYIFVVPSAPELECKIQEKGTGLFADKPNPFVENEPCGSSPDPICWASDHNGTRANLSCERSADHDFVSLRGDSREDTR